MGHRGQLTVGGWRLLSCACGGHCEMAPVKTTGSTAVKAICARGPWEGKDGDPVGSRRGFLHAFVCLEGAGAPEG